jgi:hypothetical protein
VRLFGSYFKICHESRLANSSIGQDDANYILCGTSNAEAGKTAIDLLRFPEHEDLRDGVWSARWWSYGKTKRMRSIDREKVIQRLSAERC